MKNKKPYIVIAALALFFILVYWAGRWTVSKWPENEAENTAENATEDTTESAAENEAGNVSEDEAASIIAEAMSPDAVSIWKACVTFAGGMETEDNPWGTTAGWIEIEEEGTFALILPSTGILLSDIEGKAVFSISCEIHPSVREVSDGAGLQIWYLNDQNEILHEEEVQISSAEDWQKAYCTPGQYEGTTQVVIQCNDGGNNDDSGDWVLMKFGEVEESLFETGIGIPQDAAYEITDDYDNEPVLERGSSWDDVDVLNPSVILWNDQYYNYYSGYDGTTWRTGLAVSDDGISWTRKSEEPVLDVTEDGWDQEYIAANGSAIVIDGRVYYYYQGKYEDTGGAAIGLAISDDGESFTERTEAPVLTPGEAGSWDSVSVADPYVIAYRDVFYMYYTGQNSLGVQRLGVAISQDGISWTKYENNPIMDVGVKGAFDEAGLGEASVIRKAPFFYMLYTGRSAGEQRNIGVAVSTDGINWKKLNYEGIVDFNSEGSWNDQVICDTSLLQLDDGTVAVWYGGGDVASPDENLNGQIGLFTIQLGDSGTFTEFDPNDDWENRTLAVTDYVQGIYATEGETSERYAWASDCVKTMFDNDPDASEIVVNGYVSMEMFEAVEVDSLTLTVYVNGEILEEETFTESSKFEIRIEKPDEIIEAEAFDIEIRASASVNPLELGTGQDERDLSWRLEGIRQE